jgi:hypothetical protein
MSNLVLIIQTVLEVPGAGGFTLRELELQAEINRQLWNNQSINRDSRQTSMPIDGLMERMMRMR